MQSRRNRLSIFTGQAAPRTTRIAHGHVISILPFVGPVVMQDRTRISA